MWCSSFVLSDCALHTRWSVANPKPMMWDIWATYVFQDWVTFFMRLMIVEVCKWINTCQFFGVVRAYIWRRQWWMPNLKGTLLSKDMMPPPKWIERLGVDFHHQSCIGNLLKRACWAPQALWIPVAHSKGWRPCPNSAWNTRAPVSASCSFWGGRWYPSQARPPTCVLPRTRWWRWFCKGNGIGGTSSPPCPLGCISWLQGWGGAPRWLWRSAHVSHLRCNSSGASPACLLYAIHCLKRPRSKCAHVLIY